MKKLSLCLLTMFCIACEYSEQDLGFQKKVEFSYRGGDTVVVADYPIRQAEISDGKGGYGKVEWDEHGNATSSFQWLKVESQVSNPRVLTLHADKNNSTKPRKLLIRAYDDPEYQTIRVIQEGNDVK